MKRFSILAVVLIALFTSCINNGPKAQINDLQLLSGIVDRKLILEGTEGHSSTFSFRANHDWSIIDYKGFTCDPSSGAKSVDNESITVIATPLQSNNTADTIRLSDLNFKMLSTRFVGISAYQLPQIRLPKGNKISLDSQSGSSGSLVFVSSSDDFELVTEGDITVSLSEKSSKNEYTISVSANSENGTAENRVIGTIGFEVGGVRQESKIEIIQIAAIVLDRSEVLLPSKEGGQNIFEIDSDYEVEVSGYSEQFTYTRNKNTIAITAKQGNNGSEMVSLGAIEVSLKDNPDCRIAIEVKQRAAKAPQTIIIHFIGTALQLYYNRNIEEMLKALNLNIQGDSQVLLLTSDTNYYGTLYELRYDAILGKAVKEKVRYISLPAPYDNITFENNLREALNFAPAEKYALVIGSHGLGWVPKNSSSGSARRLSQMGININDLWKRNENAEMTRHLGDSEGFRYNVEDIAEAISANNVKFDYILFDACFMGNVESVYALRHNADYIIGSPCEVMGYGFPYAKIMQYMLQNGGTSYNLDKICSEYVNYYKKEAVTPSACVAMTKTAELEALAAAMKAVHSAGVKSDFSLSNVQYYEGQSAHSFYDLGDMVEQSCADASVATAFKTQLNKTVTSRYHTDKFYSAYTGSGSNFHTINYYSGISTSDKVEHYKEEWSQTEWYKATHDSVE